MKTIESLIPGSPAWLQSRSASKAPAVLGVSKYQTRNDLLRQMATGITQDVDAGTQARFDAGHAAEAAAREIAEDILCDGLSPVCGESDDGYLTASFDGLTFDGRIGFEHKLHREDLAQAVRQAAMGSGELPEEYRVQMDQQILVGGLDYVLFMVSDGTREKCVSVEYRSTPERAEKLLAAWRQFDADLAAYVPEAIKPAAVAAPQETLPAVSVQVTGSIAVIDNLKVFGDALTAYVERINKQPQTDDDFATLEAQAKNLKQAEDALVAAENGAIAQASSIDEMRRAVAQYREIARQARLSCEKIVKAEKENRKLAIIQRGFLAINDFVQTLEASRFPPEFRMPLPDIKVDFAGVTKGLKRIDSIQNAVETELARAKIDASTLADKIADNLRTLLEHENYKHLFQDYRTLALKEADDLAAVIAQRIAAEREREAKKAEAERERIRREEEAKAAAKVKSEQEEAERQRRAAEEAAAKIERERMRATQATTATEPAAQQPAEAVETPASRGAVAAVAAAHTGITGTGKLRDEIVDLLIDFTTTELIAAIQAIRGIKARREGRAAA